MGELYAKEKFSNLELLKNFSMYLLGKKRSILDIKKVLLIWYRDSGKDQQASFLSLPRNPEHF